jgi:KDO2-lipid IV(A) lauroyltransferase
MRKIFNYIGFGVLALVSLLPFWILYLLSDLMFLLIFYVVQYRKKVVLNNLSNSFPEKSPEEIHQIAKKFYSHFCDLLVESIKLKTISAKNLKKRMVVKNPELVDKYFDQGKSVLVLTMHYNNWEWQAILPQYLKHRTLMVYNPARNLRWDAFINHMRERFGGELVPTKKILKTVLKYQQQQIPTFTWLCADQRPKANTRFWTSFLKQETGFFPGPEALARHTNHVVLYQHIEKIKRGHYQTSFGLLTENPGKLPPDEVLHLYVHKIENLIKDRPEFYLWSHKRWKNKRE